MTVRPQTEPAENKPGAAARLPAEPLRVDRLIRAHAIHSMTGETYRSVGLRGAEIAAVSEDPDGLDALAGQATVVVEADDLTVLPAFADSHEHLIEASRNTLLVPVDKARSVAEFTGMLAEAAKAARPGAWIVTSIGWHESNLAEDRVPTLTELDAAVPDHPVLARRGGHFAVVNSAALQAAGVGPGTTDPPGGKIGRLADGSRDGALEGGAVYQVAAFAPGPGRAELAAALGTCSAAYAALGTSTIREAMTTLDDFLAYQDAWERRLLNVRARLMIRVGSELSGDEALALIRGLGARSGFGDDRLRVWGLKFVMDGGAEGAALDQPYASDPANSGHLNWDPEVMTQVCTEAVRRADRQPRRGRPGSPHIAGRVRGGRRGDRPAATMDPGHRARLAHRLGTKGTRGAGRLRDHRPACAALEYGHRVPGQLGPGPYPAGQPAGRMAGRRGEAGRRHRHRPAVQPDDERQGHGHPRHQGGRDPGSRARHRRRYGAAAVHTGHRRAARRGGTAGRHRAGDAG